MKHGEIRWYKFTLPDKKRPVLILTRNHLQTVSKGKIGSLITALSQEKMVKIGKAIRFALDILDRRGLPIRIERTCNSRKRKPSRLAFVNH